MPRNVRKSRESLGLEPASPEEKGPPTRPVLPKVIRALRYAAMALVVLAVAGSIALVFVVRHFEAKLPNVAELRSKYRPLQVTRVLARDGTLLAELGAERRTVVPIASLPPHVKLAVLAAEDASFYEHEGLNYLGIVRAFWVNLRERRTRQGGSTITQQVVKNLLLDSERSYARKIREALLARRLEQELTKDEILELYINEIYFGRGRYGIEEAARDNFAKAAKDTTIAEAAMLAGTIASPEKNSPRADMKRALVRRQFVLGQMLEKGFLHTAQHDAAKDEPVRLAPATFAASELAPEAVEIARRTLQDLEPERAKFGGFVISTTIDPRLQSAARKAVRDGLAAYDKRHGLLAPYKAPIVAMKDKKGKPVRVAPPKDPPFEGTPKFESHKVYVGTVVGANDADRTLDVRVGTLLGTVRLADYERYNPQHLPATEFAMPGAFLRVSLLSRVPEGSPADVRVPLRLESGPEGALVALDVRTREVLAIVGNHEALPGGLDRATQSRRQPGSTFKPIVYSYAIHARRFTGASLIDVTPAAFAGGYRPSNYEGWTATDPLRLREAIAQSVNVAAVRVLDDVGPANVVSWAQSLGIKSKLMPDLSLALGSYEVMPIELAGAYATLAAGGMYDEPHVVTRIVGPDGKDVSLKPRPPARRVLDEAEAYVMTNLLTSVIDHGTGVRAKSLGRPVAGKTGTSNFSKDTWFAGYSTDIAAVTWVGYDDGKHLGGGETGGSTALPAWIEFMKAAHLGKPSSDFPKPAGTVTVAIDKQTGKRATSSSTETLDEVFLEGTEPPVDEPANDATPPAPEVEPG